MSPLILTRDKREKTILIPGYQNKLCFSISGIEPVANKKWNLSKWNMFIKNRYKTLKFAKNTGKNVIISSELWYICNIYVLQQILYTEYQPFGMIISFQ